MSEWAPFRPDDEDPWSALASEMGANPGNWIHDKGNTIKEPATEFGSRGKSPIERASRDGTR